MRKLTVGTILKAKGGWDAVVIWIWYHERIDYDKGFLAVHKPGDINEESVPISHEVDGAARSILTINEPPTYDGHPADLDMTGYEL